MDALMAFSAGSLIANAAAILIWSSWVAWHRLQGEQTEWW